MSAASTYLSLCLLLQLLFASLSISYFCFWPKKGLFLYDNNSIQCIFKDQTLFSFSSLILLSGSDLCYVYLLTSFMPLVREWAPFFSPNTAFSYHKPTMVLISRWKKFCRRCSSCCGAAAAELLCRTDHLLSSCVSRQRSAQTQTFILPLLVNPCWWYCAKWHQKQERSARRHLVVQKWSQVIESSWISQNN